MSIPASYVPTRVHEGTVNEMWPVSFLTPERSYAPNISADIPQYSATLTAFDATLNMPTQTAVSQQRCYIAGFDSTLNYMF